MRTSVVFAFVLAFVLAVVFVEFAHAQTAYEYDDVGRVIRAIYDDGTFVEYTYDNNDNRTQLVVDGGGGPKFLVNGASATEGGNIVFTVTKIGFTAQSHAVNYATANDTAGAGDYTAASGVLIFLPSQMSKTVVVATVADSIFETNETVLLNLSGATNGATIFDSQGVGAIYDHSSAPTFSVNDVSVAEGENLVFTVAKTGATSQSHSVAYATANDTASLDDYTAASASLTFEPGEATKTITIATAGDAYFEADETVLLNLYLSNASNGATITDAQAAGTIVEGGSGLTFSVGNVSVVEGENITFTVTKAGGSSLGHSVSYATANGTASESDYIAVSGVLFFTPGQVTKTVMVTTFTDGVYDPSETLFLNLSDATNGAIISVYQGVGTINEDTSGPAFSVDDVSANEGGNLVFTVTKAGATSLSHSVNYLTANGTADTSDYTTTLGILSFGPSETTKTVTVATTQDTAFEPDETVLLNLLNPTNGATIPASPGIGTINNDDAPNSQPIAVNDSVVVQANQSNQTVIVLANDTDPDNDTLTITGVTQPSDDRDSVSIHPSGNYIRYTAGSWSGFAINFFTYTISDGNGGSDTAQVIVTIQGSGGF